MKAKESWNLLIIGTSQTIKRLEFLNLEFSKKAHRKPVTTDNFTVVCNIKDLCEHTLHKNNSQLNTLVDLFINLSINLQQEAISNKQTIENLTAKIKKLSQNLDYIKNQSNILVGKNINSLPLEVEKITEGLQKIKIEKKPTPYTHWQPRK